MKTSSSKSWKRWHSLWQPKTHASNDPLNRLKVLMSKDPFPYQTKRNSNGLEWKEEETGGAIRSVDQEGQFWKTCLTTTTLVFFIFQKLLQLCTIQCLFERNKKMLNIPKFFFFSSRIMLNMEESSSALFSLTVSPTAFLFNPIMMASSLTVWCIGKQTFIKLYFFHLCVSRKPLLDRTAMWCFFFTRRKMNELL